MCAVGRFGGKKERKRKGNKQESSWLVTRRRRTRACALVIRFPRAVRFPRSLVYGMGPAVRSSPSCFSYCHAPRFWLGFHHFSMRNHFKTQQINGIHSLPNRIPGVGLWVNRREVPRWCWCWGIVAWVYSLNAGRKEGAKRESR